MKHVVVVGGGVSGLVAAYRLRGLLGPGTRITVVEQASRLGGKLWTVELGGVPTDVGAEAFVLRNPSAVGLVTELGLGAELIHPGPASATVHAGGRTVPLPRRTFLGVPASADAVRGVLSDEGAARVAAEVELPPLELPAAGDVAVGEVLAQRFGRELVDHLVEPLLGGVYAGRADLLGLRATMPALAAGLEEAGGSLTRAAARLLGGAAPGGSPAGGSDPGRSGGGGAPRPPAVAEPPAQSVADSSPAPPAVAESTAPSAAGLSRASTTPAVTEPPTPSDAGLSSSSTTPALAEPLTSPDAGISSPSTTPVAASSGGEASPASATPEPSAAGRSSASSLPAAGRPAAAPRVSEQIATGPQPPGTGRPAVFGALRGGMRVLVDALVRQAAVEVKVGYPARELRREPDGWRLEIGSPGRAETLHADAVVLAVPPPAARRLLAEIAPAAAAAYAGIEVGSMAVLTMVFPDAVRLPDSSGVLLAVGQRHAGGTPFTAKAFTHTSVKWGGAPVRLRASIGRVGETGLLRRDDEDLLAAVLRDLRELSGVESDPIDWRLTRWGGGLPQYGVGHLAAVEAIERAVAEVPGLAVAGASFRGVGIPACVDAATAAAERVAGHLLAHTDAG